MAKILIAGYYGFDNAGDDAVLYGIVSSLKKMDPAVQIRVLSNKPEKTTDLFQIPAYNRWNLYEIITQIARSDLVILGGGTLLQDRTSPRSPLYYLGITLLAKMMGKPVFYYGQGFGPIIHPFSKKMIRWIVNRVDAITVRDRQSREEMKAYGVTRAPIHVTADPALTIDPGEADPNEAREILKKFRVDPGKPIVYVSVRDWKKEENFKGELARICDWLAERGWQIAFIAMQHPNDLSPSLDIIARMKHPATLMDQPFNFKQIMSLIALGRLMIGMRLHAVILSAVMNVPFIALSYDPKIDRFVESLGKETAGPIEEVDYERIKKQLEDILMNLPGEKAFLRKRVEPIVEKAFESARLVHEILRKKAD